MIISTAGQLRAVMRTAAPDKKIDHIIYYNITFHYITLDVVILNYIIVYCSILHSTTSLYYIKIGARARASTRRHQTCHFHKRATSAPAEGPAYGLDFARYCEFPLRAPQAQK